MIKTWFVVIAAAALLHASCATAGSSDADDDDDVVVVDPDADPNAPDADPNAPDANPNAPDANPNAPDGTPVGGDIDASGGICPTTPCDLVEQCGCTDPQVCDLNLSMLGSTACRNVNTPGTETSTCAALQDCAGGYVCVSGSCSTWCAVDADCGNTRRKCIVALQSGGTPIPGAVTCSSACNPANAAAGFCPAGFSCHLSFLDPDGVAGSGDETPFATCGAAGAIAAGGACAANTDCVQNHLCVNTGTLACVRMCTVAPAGGECPGGTTCNGLSPQMLIGGVEYGGCF